MNEMCEKTSGCSSLDMLLSTAEGARRAERLSILTEALFNAASLGYKGECLSFDSLTIDAVLRAVYPGYYRETLESLRSKAKREHENVKPEDDEF